MAHSIHPFFTFLTTLIFLTFSSSASDNNFPASTISAAPSSLSLSSSPPSPFSPDISPLLPTPHLSPTESSLPIIPSTPSPPKPDDDAMAAPGPFMAVGPSPFLPYSASQRLVGGGGCLNTVMVTGLAAFGLL